MATLLGLEGKLNRYVEKVKRRANEVTKEVARTILKELTEKTPVDTSQAISNWQVGINNPVMETKGPIVPGENKSSYIPSSHQAFVIGNSILMLRHFGEPIYISNYLDYIEDLEYGKSPQNAAFVFTAIESGKSRLAELTK